MKNITFSLLQKNLIKEITILIEDYRIKAQEISEVDPLQNISIIDEIEGDNPICFKIIIAYISGRGKESSYTINDVLSFKISKVDIHDIYIEQSFERIKKDPISLDDNGGKVIIDIIEDFFNQIIGYGGVFPNDDINIKE